MRGKSIVRDDNPLKKRKFSGEDDAKETTSSTNVTTTSTDKQAMTFALFRTTSTDLSMAKQRLLGLTPYLCEKLPAKHVVSYASLLFRVPLDLLSKFITRLPQPDVKVIEWAKNEGKHWEAHRVGRLHRLKTPINAEKYGYQNFSYLQHDHPLIIQFLKENKQARQYAEQYEITWVLVSIKPSLEIELASGNKGWEMRLPITSVLLHGEKAIEHAITNPFKRAPQDLSQKSTKDSVEKGKVVVRYILQFVDDLHKYVIEKANESDGSYYPRQDSVVIYAGDHIQQFNVTLDQAFSAIPLKISSRNYTAGKWRRKDKPTLKKLIAKYNPGTAEALS